MNVIDDDTLIEAFERRPLTSAETKTLTEVRAFVERGDFAVNRRPPRVATEAVIGAAIAALLVALVFAFGRHAAPTPRPAATPSSITSPSLGPTAIASPPRPATPLIALPLEGPGAFRAVDVASGDLWVTFGGNPQSTAPLAASLVRFDATTGRRLSSWAVGGDPLGIAVSGGFVWVANGSGDHSAPLADTDTILQLDAASGAVLRRYSVTQPIAIVSKAGTAWVLAGGTGNVPVEVVRLEGGSESNLGELPVSLTLTTGVYSNLAICGGSAVFATTGVAQTLVFAFPLHGGPYHQVATIPTSGVMTLACTADSAIFAVDNANDGGLFRVALSTGSVAGPFGEKFASGVIYVNGRFLASMKVFGKRTDTTYLVGVDPVTGQPAAVQTPLAIGGTGALVGGDASGVWVAPDQGNAALVKVKPS